MSREIDSNLDRHMDGAAAWRATASVGGTGSAASRVFQSFFMGGFECASFRHSDGRRLDLLQSTRHDVHAAQDYLALQRHGIRSVRDGVRWHRIETLPGEYDWSSFLPMLRASLHTGTQPVWDLFHYGWPDDLDIWSGDFVDRFARFAGALAHVVREESDVVPFYCPVNEISFMSWAAGDMGFIFPFQTGRGNELKRQLVRASIAAIDAIRSVAPNARFVQPEPAIHVMPQSPEDEAAAAGHRLAQYAACDMLIGTSAPELGGTPGYLDIVGVNYYSYNQWFLDGRTVFQGEPDYRPFREILMEIWQRYRRPTFIAETGAEGDRRVPWFDYVCDEADAAIAAGVGLEGICLYPITDYPGWDNDRHCDTGLLGYAGNDGHRDVYGPLANALVAQQLRRLPGRARNEPLGFADLRTMP
jgi:hypothetical protein